MNRVFFTGDTHNNYDYGKIFLFDRKMKKMKQKLDKSDIMVIMGDWGGIWYNDDRDEQFVKECWETKPWTTFAVLGNHECYDKIEKYPVVEFCGAAARKISDSVYTAITGESYNINGLNCLVINGADSHDIYNPDGSLHRHPHISWWEQEQLSEYDTEQTLQYLYTVPQHYDFILSHTGGTEVCRNFGFKPTISDERLDKILAAANYDVHVCGHYHKDMWVNDKTLVMYNDIIEVK